MRGCRAHLMILRRVVKIAARRSEWRLVEGCDGGTGVAGVGAERAAG